MKFNKTAFFQALGLATYFALVANTMVNGERIFGNVDNSYLGPLTFLTLFSVSVLTCGLIVFYKPYRLFLEGKKKESIQVVLMTTAYLFVFLFVFISVLFLIKQ